MENIKVGDVFYIEPRSFATTSDDIDKRGKKLKARVIALNMHYFTVEFQLRGGAVKESFQYWELNSAEAV